MFITASSAPIHIKTKKKTHDEGKKKDSVFQIFFVKQLTIHNYTPYFNESRINDTIKNIRWTIESAINLSLLNHNFNELRIQK